MKVSQRLDRLAQKIKFQNGGSIPKGVEQYEYRRFLRENGEQTSPKIKENTTRMTGSSLKGPADLDVGFRTIS